LGVFEGNHRLGGYRTVLQSLAEHEQVPLRAKQVLARAASRVGQEGRLWESLSTYGSVMSGASAGNQPKSTIAGSQRVIVCPLRWFDASDKVQPTILLGENLSDVGVLDVIARTAMALKRLPYLPLKHDKRGGGGSSTGQTLASIVATGRQCICVVDSDRPCSNGVIGATASGIQVYKNVLQYPTVEVLETGGRDLENCLPDQFYQNEYGNHHQHSAMANALRLFATSGDDEARAHIDIEKGLTLRQVFACPSGTPERVFLDRCVNSVCTALGYPSNHFACVATSTCATALTGSCTCVVVRGITRNILERFVELYATDMGYGLASLLSPSERAEWLRLGLAIASWCCAEPKLRA
jgi:hypothetical protein